MNELTRRRAIQAAGLGAAALSGLGASAAAETVPMGMKNEGAGTPKICLEIGGGALAAGSMDDAGMRRIKQLGVNSRDRGNGPHSVGRSRAPRRDGSPEGGRFDRRATS